VDTGLRNVIGSHNEDHVKAFLSPPSTPLLVTYEERLETLTFSMPRGGKGEGKGEGKGRARKVTRERTADGRTGSAVALLRASPPVRERERERERERALRLLFRATR
jgi:hypothetical protein